MARKHVIRRPIATAAGVVVLLAVVFGLVWRSVELRRHGTEIPPNQIYEALFQSAVPDLVMNLQASGTTWQGHNIYLRFSAPSFEASGISSPPYESVKCADIAVYLTLPKNINSNFSPDWSVPMTDSASCIAARQLSNAWTKLRSHYLMKSGEWVHFAGHGS